MAKYDFSKVRVEKLVSGAWQEVLASNVSFSMNYSVSSDGTTLLPDAQTVTVTYSYMGSNHAIPILVGDTIHVMYGIYEITGTRFICTDVTRNMVANPTARALSKWTTNFTAQATNIWYVDQMQDTVTAPEPTKNQAGTVTESPYHYVSRWVDVIGWTGPTT